MSEIHLLSNPGVRALAVIDFNTTGEAAADITIGGVSFTEADTEDFVNGTWTNGASAADSATSLNDAVNGDTRQSKPNVSSFLSDAGDSVIVVADRPGTAGNLAVTTDSAGAVTVENMHGGGEAGRMKAVVVDYVVTAQDVLADEVNIPLPFTPAGFVVNARTTAGVIDAVTVEAAMQASPDRLRLNFAGATDPVAGDIVHAIVWG